jgi:UDP-N-acetylmuramate--alanine ligase
VTRSAEEIGRGLAQARDPRPIHAGERIHVIGAAGAGASAAAYLAARAGAMVTACDPGAPSPYTAELETIDVDVWPGHDPEHVVTRSGRVLVDRVAVTKALTSIAADHPELVAAREAAIPLEAWQQVVADAACSQGGRLVGVAGTHGKSTSAGWLVHVLVDAGRDPGAFVGALLPAALTGTVPGTARWGSGDAFVVEADEYAGNFDPYRPDVAVVLNAEWDHPDVFADENAVLDAFEAWLLAPGAKRRTVVVNALDRGAAALGRRVRGRVGAVLEVGQAERDGIAGQIALPGAHNLANAACVAAAARVLAVAESDITRGLSTFHGVGRRLELKADVLGVTVYDDYGHHPTAIAATMAAVRERHPGRRLIAVYEPLTFHRTAAMQEQFADVLADADEARIADIWAGRDPDTSVTSPLALAAAINRRGKAPATPTGSPEETADSLLATVQKGDVVLVMGGGRSYVIAERLAEGLRRLAADASPLD